MSASVVTTDDFQFSRYIATNICILCGFSFIVKSSTADGIVYTKATDRKLKLSAERVCNIEKVLGKLESAECVEKGVCVRCYRLVERVLKKEDDADKLTAELSAPLRISQRTLNRKRSLDVGSPERSDQQVKVLALATECSGQANKENATVRRCLGKDFARCDPSLEGEIEVAIHYKSGTKSKFIAEELHKRMCKVIFREENVVKGIVDLIKKECPDVIISASAEIVSHETKELCKRDQETALHDRSHDGILKFSWANMHKELQIRAPHVLKVVSAMVCDIPSSVSGKPFQHVMHSIAIALHGRSREMTVLQYLSGLVLMHGGCTHKDIERLAKIGVSVTSDTLRKKMDTWQNYLDEEILKIKGDWSKGGSLKYQLVGDNWDKNILPSYRTSQQKTQSLHLFNVVAVLDRVQARADGSSPIRTITELKARDFIPSLNDQDILTKELTFLVSSAVVNNVDQISKVLGNIYPGHLEHRYSAQAGMKTQQHTLGLFDCNETRTQDMIHLMKELSQLYVPLTENGDIVEEVFFGGDRLTDERIQGAQQSMANADHPKDRLEGFISKIEDFHRLMNFLEAICKLTFSTGSSRDRGTAYYYRNLLNASNVKGEVKNAYRPFKKLYHTIFDGICCVLFFREFGLKCVDENIPLPDDWAQWIPSKKIEWLDSISQRIVKKWFFEDGDLLSEVRDVLSDPDHEENYWVVNATDDGRFTCHYCTTSYAFIGSLKVHEKMKHGHQDTARRQHASVEHGSDELFNYIVCLFRLVALHKNLDSAVDMGDGQRVVRSAKYETPIYNRTSKSKYLIGSIHLTGMTSGTLPEQQTERLVANRFINLSGGKNNNLALDEYVELVNRDIKNTCTGFQTKESIIKHSKEYPHLIEAVKQWDSICEVHKRKGFHKLPSYQADVKKIASDLLEIDAFNQISGRKLHCRSVVQTRNPYDGSYTQLATMIHRHKPVLPFRRLKNKKV